MSSETSVNVNITIWQTNAKSLLELINGIHRNKESISGWWAGQEMAGEVVKEYKIPVYQISKF